MSSPLCKNILIFRNPNHCYISRRPVPQGALRNVINAGRDAVDAEARLTKRADADGEVVWS
jgi:hypothetical protein